MRFSSAITTALCLLIAIPSLAKASDFITWHSSNIQLLKGWDHKVGQAERTLITVEHAHSWKYGDFFMFIDATRFDDGGTTAFGEFSPRFSLSKITGKELSWGIIKDVLISTTYEKGKASIEAYLYGGAIDFNIPGFTFFKSNLYLRDNPDIDNETWQVTLSWQYPFSIGNTQWVTEGFADFAGEEGNRYNANEHIVPRLLLDIGDLIYNKDKQLYAGVEWDYWHNKFGINGVTQSCPQLQLKWIF